MTDDGAVQPPEDALGAFVHQTVNALWRGFQENRASAVAALAKLRHSYPHGGIVRAESFEFLGDRFIHGQVDRDGVTSDERAAAAALALFAFHQQSNMTVPMHRRGVDHRLGRAAATLTTPAGEAGVRRRVNSLVTAPDVVAVLEHLRGLVQMMRAHQVPLDYAQLARDLRAVHDPTGLRTTRIRWSRDYHHVRTESTESTKTPGAEA